MLGIRSKNVISTYLQQFEQGKDNLAHIFTNRMFIKKIIKN
ncbi:hypothetical protein SHAQ108633_18770 [Shewanella aquimarina]